MVAIFATVVVVVTAAAASIVTTNVTFYTCIIVEHDMNAYNAVFVFFISDGYVWSY